jgi:hypothetical protein
MKTFTLIWIQLSLCAVIMCSCAVEYPQLRETDLPRERRVVDVESGEPVAGAIILMHWERYATDIANTFITCERAVAIESGPDGRYILPEWRGRRPQMGRVYKPGYSDAGDWPARERGIDQIKRFRGTPAQRDQELLSVGNALKGCKELQGMTELWSQVAQEAKALARTAEEARVASDLQFNVDQAQFGIEEARRRRLAREALIRDSSGMTQ